MTSLSVPRSAESSAAAGEPAAVAVALGVALLLPPPPPHAADKARIAIRPPPIRGSTFLMYDHLSEAIGLTTRHRSLGTSWRLRPDVVPARSVSDVEGCRHLREQIQDLLGIRRND